MPEFMALVERHLEAEKARNYRAALVASTVINAAPGRKRVVKPEDFFREKKYKPVDVEDLKQTLTWIARTRGGKLPPSGEAG
jgi:hypothetical protein